MNQKTYTYSILKYRHSQLLDEQLNVGLIVYFPDINKFAFEHSSNLKRVKAIYENVSDKVILHYLKQIDKRIEFLNNRPSLFGDYDIEEHFSQFIHKELIASDASTLQFTKAFQGISYNETPKAIIDFLLVSYFSEFKTSLIETTSKSLRSVSERFFNKIAAQVDIETLEKEQKLFKKYKVENETGKTYTFDYAWQNGTLNLVRPLNFDLKTGKGIEDKAHKTLGLFIDLENEALKDNLKYDLLVSKPTNKDFYKDYDHALKLLELPKRVELVEETDINAYSKRAIEALS